MDTTPAVPGDQADSHGVATSAVLVIATTLLVAVLAFFKRLPGFRGNLPPGPRGWPLLGSLPYLGTLPHRALRKLSRKYGPIMFMYWGSEPTVVVSNADMAKEFLKTHDQHMSSRPQRVIANHLLYGGIDMLSSPYGDHWKKLRKICALNLLNTTRISQFQALRQREVTWMLQAIHNECQLTKPVEALRFLAAMSTNIITQMIWGKRHCGISGGKDLARAEGIKFNTIIREVSALMGAINIGDFIPILEYPAMKIQGFDRRMKAVRDTVDSFLNKIIQEHQQTETSIENSDEAEDFIHQLLKHSQEAELKPEGALTNNTMKAVILNMLLGGSDTSSTTLEWALTELVKQPNLMAKAQDELKSTVGLDRLVTDADIPNLKYLQAVVKEALRMHPAAPLAIPHKSIHDCVIGGYHIPAETVVIFNILAIQTDPSMWERPQEFDPDRFLDSLIDVKGQHFEMIPFGAGRRMCPGMNLGLATVSLALANLLHAFSWSLPEGQVPEEMDMSDICGVTTPKAIPLTVLAKPRLPHHVIYPST